MKILFLCGSLEPGRDGVGDYTRRLAGECIRQGHEALMIALNDKGPPAGDGAKVKHKKSPDVDLLANGGRQDDYGTPVPVWRWPKSVSWHKRGNALMKLIGLEQPDIVSIQFVPYSFNRKGLPFSFVRMIRGVAETVHVKWHVFFHELWVGSQADKLLTTAVVSTLQRRLVGQLKFCDVCHTHLPVYKKSLDHLGYEAIPLPLFSNIPCSTHQADDSQTPVMDIGFFSQQSPNDSVCDWLIGFILNAKKEGRTVKLHLAGGVTPDAEKYWKKSLTGHAGIQVHGWMPPAEVSKYLRSLDLGITTVPQHALGKSGSVAAFIEHGLPFAAPNPGLVTNGLFLPFKFTRPGIYQMDPHLISLQRHANQMVESLVPKETEYA